MAPTENHKDSKFDFVYDLQKEIPRWVAHGLIDSDQSKNILEYYKVTADTLKTCLLYTSPSPRDGLLSRMPSSA